MKKVVIVIPARRKSTRIPDKPLYELAGKAMLAWVIENCLKVSNADETVVATDDEEIARLSVEHGAKAIMTSESCNNGTDRCIEAIKSLEGDIFVNVQGDEPMIKHQDLEKLIDVSKREAKNIISMFYQTENEETNSSAVNVVLNKEGEALYFSRSKIPWGSKTSNIHVGIYAFHKTLIGKIKNLKTPKNLESENLEQLAWLYGGVRIRMVECTNKPRGVNTYEDAREVDRYLRMSGIKAIALDVDGVMTDGTLLYGKDGEIVKAFNAKDGMALNVWKKKQLTVAIISGKKSYGLKKRIDDLKIKDFYLGVDDKVSAIREFAKNKLTTDEICYLGDDVNDILAMRTCGMSFAVADAVDDVKAEANQVLTRCGGHGAVRELVELLLEYKQSSVKLEWLADPINSTQ